VHETETVSERESGTSMRDRTCACVCERECVCECERESEFVCRIPWGPCSRHCLFVQHKLTATIYADLVVRSRRARERESERVRDRSVFVYGCSMVQCVAVCSSVLQ